MNLAEKLSREVTRVTVLRERYAALRGMPGTNFKPAIALMNAALEAAHQAAGVGDALTNIAALQDLQGFTE